MMFIIIVGIVGLLLVILDIIDMVLNPRFEKRLVDHQSIRRDKRSLGHLVALVLSSAPLALFYSPNFQLESFCTMNKRESICQNKWNKLGEKIDCLTLGSRTDVNQQIQKISFYVDTMGGNFTLGHDFNKSTFKFSVFHYI